MKHLISTTIVLAMACPALCSAQVLEFGKLRDEMNKQYKTYFAHHKLSSLGSKDEGKRKIFYITFPDPDMRILITARCDPLNEGGWMCMLTPNYGNFGVLPLPVR